MSSLIKIRGLLPLLAALSALVLAPAAASQRPIVMLINTNSDGAPVPGAIVQLINQDTQKSIKVKMGENGTWLAPASAPIPSGRCRLVVAVFKGGQESEENLTTFKRAEVFLDENTVALNIDLVKGVKVMSVSASGEKKEQLVPLESLAMPRPGLNKPAGSSAATWYLANCQFCHGPEGRGTPIAKKMGAPDMSTVAFQSKTDAQLIESITKGKGKMRAFQLTAEESQTLVAFLRTFATK